MEDPVRIALVEELRTARVRLEVGKVRYDVGLRRRVQSMVDQAIHEMASAREDIARLTLALSPPQVVTGSSTETQPPEWIPTYMAEVLRFINREGTDRENSRIYRRESGPGGSLTSRPLNPRVGRNNREVRFHDPAAHAAFWERARPKGVPDNS